MFLSYLCSLFDCKQQYENDSSSTPQLSHLFSLPSLAIHSSYILFFYFLQCLHCYTSFPSNYFKLNSLACLLSLLHQVSPIILWQLFNDNSAYSPTAILHSLTTNLRVWGFVDFSLNIVYSHNSIHMDLLALQGIHSSTLWCLRHTLIYSAPKLLFSQKETVITQSSILPSFSPILPIHYQSSLLQPCKVNNLNTLVFI